MIVSGFHAPHLPYKRPRVHNLPESDVQRRLKELGGTPVEILEDPEFMAVLMPVIRADLAICETYVFEPHEPLSCSVTALAGNDDSQASVEEVSAWRRQTNGPFSFRMFAGNHFFFQESRRAVVDALEDDVAEVLRRVKRSSAESEQNSLATSYRGVGHDATG
jgi:surfactin synthase thioesterase subunit